MRRLAEFSQIFIKRRKKLLSPFSSSLHLFSCVSLLVVSSSLLFFLLSSFSFLILDGFEQDWTGWNAEVISCWFNWLWVFLHASFCSALCLHVLFSCEGKQLLCSFSFSKRESRQESQNQLLSLLISLQGIDVSVEFLVSFRTHCFFVSFALFFLFVALDRWSKKCAPHRTHYLCFESFEWIGGRRNPLCNVSSLFLCLSPTQSLLFCVFVIAQVAPNYRKTHALAKSTLFTTLGFSCVAKLLEAVPVYRECDPEKGSSGDQGETRRKRNDTVFAKVWSHFDTFHADSAVMLCIHFLTFSFSRAYFCLLSCHRIPVQVTEVLARGECISICPEGLSSDENEIRELKPGVAVIALKAAAEGTAVQIVPLVSWCGHELNRKKKMGMGRWNKRAEREEEGAIWWGSMASIRWRGEEQFSDSFG